MGSGPDWTFVRIQHLTLEFAVVVEPYIRNFLKMTACLDKRLQHSHQVEFFRRVLHIAVTTLVTRQATRVVNSEQVPSRASPLTVPEKGGFHRFFENRLSQFDDARPPRLISTLEGDFLAQNHRNVLWDFAKSAIREREPIVA